MSSTSRALINSSSLLLLARSVQRGLGLISVVVLARLLSPEDFAVVAISALVLFFCEALSTSGSEPYLIRKEQVSDVDASSAWTLDMALKGTVFLLLNASVPAIGQLYDDPRLVPVLHVVSCVLLLNAVRSPGLILLKRELHYSGIIKLLVVQKFLAFGVTVAVAIWLRSYWALVIGDLVAALVMTVGSYLAHPFRPRFTRRAWKEQWWFSRWLLVKENVGYTKAQMDIFFVTKLFSDEAVGAYFLTRSLSVVPSDDVIGPAVEPLLVPLSQSRDNLAVFRQQLRKILVAIAMLAIPLAAFMFTQPEPLIDFMFGPQWTVAYALLPPLTLVFLSMAFSQVLSQVFMALGRVRTLLTFETGSMLTLLAVFLMVSGTDIETFAYYRALLAVVLVLGFYLYLNATIRLSLVTLALRFLPLLLAAALACIAAAMMEPLFDQWLGSFRLLPLGVAYLVVYGVIALGVLVAGRRYWREYDFILGLIMERVGGRMLRWQRARQE